MLPPHLVQQLTWGWFINTQGGTGNNIPCDLHNEHVNKIFNDTIIHMGVNFSEEATTRVARSVTFVSEIAHRFEQQTNIHPECSVHCKKEDYGDLKKVMKVVIKEKLWDTIPGRVQNNFHNITSNPLKFLNMDKLKNWISQKMKETIKYRKLQVSDSDGSESDTSLTN